MRVKSQKQKQNSNLTEPLKIKVLFVLPVCAASARNGGNILIILSANKIQHTLTHNYTCKRTHTRMYMFVDRRVANVFDISAYGVYTLTHINYHLSCLVAPALPTTSQRLLWIIANWKFVGEGFYFTAFLSHSRLHINRICIMKRVRVCTLCVCLCAGFIGSATQSGTRCV